MLDQLKDLPGPYKNESAVINLDTTGNTGTHWISFRKTGDSVSYYDSFGGLKPPPPLIRYLYRNKPINISYNKEADQSFEENICGYLCLKFLQT